MDPYYLKAMLKKQPFEPFRLVMSDGRSYDVRHPELLTVGMTSSTIGVFDKYAAPKEDRGPEFDFLIPDLLVWVDNGHVTTTIPLAVADQVGQATAT